MSNSWSIPIDRLAAKAKVDINTVARKVVFEVFNAVVLRSPVRTGRFRANWNISVVQPDYATSQATSAQDKVAAVLDPGFALQGSVFLSNGLPYARRLEYGWSGQAPQGMVRVTVAEFSQHVQAALQ